MSVHRMPAEHVDLETLGRSWERDGAAVIEGFFTAGQVRAWRDRLDVLRQQCAREAPLTAFDASKNSHGSDRWFSESGGEVRAFFEPSMPAATPASDRARWVNKLGHALHDRDEVLGRAFRDPRLPALLQAVGCTSPLLVQSMAVFKEARVGEAVPVHQDGTFLATEPQSVVGLWFALDPADSANGCLWVAAGHHHGPLGARYVRRNDSLDMVSQRALEIPDASWVAVPARSGDLVLLHGMLPHRSSANRSERPRWAMTLHVVSGHASWSPQNWLVRESPFSGF
jgi:phytanoyl-CoA hydroxylase